MQMKPARLVTLISAIYVQTNTSKVTMRFDVSTFNESIHSRFQYQIVQGLRQQGVQTTSFTHLLTQKIQSLMKVTYLNSVETNQYAFVVCTNSKNSFHQNFSIQFCFDCFRLNHRHIRHLHLHLHFHHHHPTFQILKGKKINQSPEGGMCVACGSATCSQQCHDKQILNKNKCLFHINFSVDMEGFSMRSLLFQNVDFLHQNQMAKGTPVVQTSRNFVYGMLSDDPNIVYLQRGYRIYGNPVPQTLDAIEIVDQTNLDFVLHEKQMCSCQCQNCDSRDIHPEHNCIFDCQRDSAMLKTEFENDERLNVNCDCKCEFCSSGVTIKTHSRQDCIFFCKSYQRVRKNENDKNNNQSYV